MFVNCAQNDDVGNYSFKIKVFWTIDLKNGVLKKIPEMVRRIFLDDMVSKSEQYLFCHILQQHPELSGSTGF